VEPAEVHAKEVVSVDNGAAGIASGRRCRCTSMGALQGALGSIPVMDPR